jgi:hypothetical protein
MQFSWVFNKFLITASIFAATNAATSCNGSPALCTRQYSNITQIGAHNSAFVGQLPSHNQLWSVTQQLDNGVRFLTAQTHPIKVFGTTRPFLCHTNCWLLNQGPLVSYLQEVKRWLDGHREEVVTLLVTNEQRMGMAAFAEEFRKAGLEGYAFVPGRTIGLGEWPTLGQMIDSGKRLVVFVDYGNDGSVLYLLDEFQYFWETPFSTTDPAFPQCSVDRGQAEGRMGIVNHYLNVDVLPGEDEVLVPWREKAEITNGAVSILVHATRCRNNGKGWPRVILLDYVDKGDWKSAEAVLNSL